MAMMMQFLQDTQAAGRCFPRGSQLSVRPTGNAALVPPDTAANTMLCLVPLQNLAPLFRFRALLLNCDVGLQAEADCLGMRASGVLEDIANRAPHCTVVAFTQLDGPA